MKTADAYGSRCSRAARVRRGRPRRVDGSIIGMLLLVGGTILWGMGCSKDDCVECTDTTPPAVPSGVFSVTGNDTVTVYWNDVDEADVAGYAVYRNEDGSSTFSHVRDLGRDENYDANSGLHYYVDTDVTNGATYYYAIASFDNSNNESALSWESVFDTPRPAGNDVELFDQAVDPAASGFDFSAAAGSSDGVVSGTSPTADIRVVWDAGTPFVEAARPSIVSLQDYGTVMNDDQFINLDWVSYAPLNGYSITGRAELIRGHAYVVRIVENPAIDVHYAKFAVTAVRTSSVQIDWAYQGANNNRELKSFFAPGTGGRNRTAGSDVVRF